MDYPKAVQIAKIGAKINPKSIAVKNNLVFSLINMGDIEGAQNCLRECKHTSSDDYNEPSLLATRGLLSFRSGNPAAGKDLYESALIAFRKKKNRRSEILASLFYAIEKVNSNTFRSDLRDIRNVIDKAEQYTKTIKKDEYERFADIKLMTSRLVKEVNKKGFDV